MDPDMVWLIIGIILALVVIAIIVVGSLKFSITEQAATMEVKCGVDNICQERRDCNCYVDGCSFGHLILYDENGTIVHSPPFRFHNGVLSGAFLDRKLLGESSTTQAYKVSAVCSFLNFPPQEVINYGEVLITLQ